MSSRSIPPASGSTPSQHEAISTGAADGVETGTVLETLERGYRVDGQVIRPARVVVSDRRRADGARPLRGARGRQEGDRRGDQAGLPQAGARLPPRPQPRTTRRPRSASRRSAAPTRRSRTPRSASNTTPAGCSAASAAVGAARRPGRLRPNVGVGDIFSTLFGRGGRGGPAADRAAATSRPRSRSASSRRWRAPQIPVTVPKQSTCKTCSGNGAAPGTKPVTCPRCEGRGVDAQSQGFFSISQPCPQCGGRGQIVESPCPDCRGSGLTLQRKRYRVNVPAGVNDGTPDPARRQGRGRAARRPAGRSLRHDPGRAPHRSFASASDGNLEVDVPITLAEAIGGGTSRCRR